MAYVPVPKDMNAVKTKVAFNLTKRQIVCFGGGLLVGLPVFFLISKGSSPVSMTWMMWSMRGTILSPSKRKRSLRH